MPEALLTSDNLLARLDDEAHVWFCSPDEMTDPDLLLEYQTILSASERTQQQRFLFMPDRHRYLVSHALVRNVLSMYCDVLPEKWEFSINQHGRPEIFSELKRPSLRFNLSHAEGMSVCVVTLGWDCGVDVENTERQNKLLPIARRMFADKELETMREVSDAKMRRKFFEYWTLREAYVKALGTGLGGSSKQFYFNIHEQNEAGRTIDICITQESAKSKLHWQFALLEPSDKHQVAVAVQSEQQIKIRIISQQIPMQS